MKNGYYLSTFVAFDPLANQMEVKLRHDQNVSLWKKDGNNVELVKYWELERITGKKQHNETFSSKDEVLKLLNFLLKEEGLSMSDIQETWGTLGLEKELKFFHPNNLSFHSVAHVFSSLFVNGSDTFYKNNIIALAVDGGPDNLWEEDAFSRNFYAGAVAINGKVSFFPISSPGQLWAHSRKRFGMGEGTLMALATASPTRFLEVPEPKFLGQSITNRSLWPEIADYLDNLIKRAELFTENDAGVLHSGFDDRFSRNENIASMVMKEVQSISNEIMKKNVEDILASYQLDPKDTMLALSGGFCLNCPSNSFLMGHFGFKELLAPPCINDAGISLGQALYYFHYSSTESLNLQPLSAYQGQEFPCPDFNSETLKHYISNVSDFDGKQFALDVQEYPIVWFNGRSELGPRALGNRSLLSDPRTLEMKDSLNNIKQREWWRPVAPVVLEDKADLFFSEKRRSPFMLELVEVKRDVSNQIPAVSHLDTTARIQTLSREDNALLYDAINAFFEQTGVPLLCNTSLNDKNEPIINSFEEALNFSLRKGIKVMYVNGHRVGLQNHEAYEVKMPLRRATQFSIKMELDPSLNPHSLSRDEVTVYWDYKNSLGANAIREEGKIQEIKQLAQTIKNRYGYLAR